MSKTAVKLRKNSYVLEDVSVQCIATDKGYFGGRIISEGEKFMYKGVLKDGKFPLWCEPVEKFVSKKKATVKPELTEEEKAAKKKLLLRKLKQLKLLMQRRN